MTLKILLDHQIFYRQNYGGVSRYFCELMNQFSKDSDMHFTLPLRYVQNDNLSQFPKLNTNWSGRYNGLYNNTVASLLQKKIRFNALNFGLNFLINNRGESVRLLKAQDFDIFHPTYYDPYFLKHLQKKPYVITVYDMIHELFPNYFKASDPTRIWKKQLIENAGAVIAISENTKQDILKFTDVDPGRVHVIYLGNPFENISSHPKTNPNSENPYLLFVGTRSAYKGFGFFIESVSEVLHKYPDLQVICAGSFRFTFGEREIFKKLGILQRVHHVNINDTILVNLYKNARAFIFPSLYEGFGLPILEAFSCNCPVILNHSGSLPEVGGNGAMYFKPGNGESLAGAVETVLFNETCRKDLIRKGSERLKLFSWDRTALLTKEVYNRCRC